MPEHDHLDTWDNGGIGNDSKRAEKIKGHKQYDPDNVSTQPPGTSEFNADEWLKSIDAAVDAQVKKENDKAKKDPSYTAKTKDEIQKDLLDKKTSGRLNKSIENNLVCYKEPPGNCCESFVDKCGTRWYCVKNDAWVKSCCDWTEKRGGEKGQKRWADARAALKAYDAGETPTPEQHQALLTIGGSSNLERHDARCNQNQNGVMTRKNRRRYGQNGNGGDSDFQVGSQEVCNHQLLVVRHRPDYWFPACSFPWYEMVLGHCQQKWWPAYIHIVSIPWNDFLLETKLSKQIDDLNKRCENDNDDNTKSPPPEVADNEKTKKSVTVSLPGKPKPFPIGSDVGAGGN